MTGEKIHEPTVRSQCPTNLLIEDLGDQWSFLIIRDLMLNDKRHFREILRSKENISAKTLSDRLDKLEQRGFLTKTSDPTHKQKILYSLTERGIDLFPILLEFARWSLKYKPVDPTDRALAEKLLSGGELVKEQFMNALREKHLKRKE